MKIPTGFEVFAHGYTVSLEENMSRDKAAMGQASGNAQKIILDPSFSQSQIGQTFWHEKVHVAAYETGVKLSERDTDLLGQALHQIECSSVGDLFKGRKGDR